MKFLNRFLFNTLRALVLVLTAVAGPTLAGTARAAEVPGRVILELTEAGARALRAGRLLPAIPEGGEALHPALEPLFVSRDGPLSRYAVLTFHPALGEASAALPRENGEWIQAALGAGWATQAASDQVLPVSKLPNDPGFYGFGTGINQWHLYNVPDEINFSLHAPFAWPFVPANREVVVAVIDTGVHWRHPDLGGANPPWTGRLWNNVQELNGNPGQDDDLNGYKDDVVGWDFVDIDSVPCPPGTSPPGCQGQYEPAGDEDGRVPDADPSDVVGHGTHVTGLITALTDNGLGIAGGAPNARIMCLRVGWQTVGGTGVVYMSFCARAIEYAAAKGARVINCSWDSQNVLGLGAALDDAINNHDVVVVGSAGNQGTSTPSYEYLAQRGDCLGVAGVSSTGHRLSFSNFGSWVDIAAFGKGMLSLVAGRMGSGYGTSFAGGTSFASPQIVAEAALIRMAAPWSSAAQVRDLIRTHGRDLSAVEPLAASLGGGLADYAAAVTAAGGGWEKRFRATGLSLAGPSLPGRVVARGDSTLYMLGVTSGVVDPAFDPGPMLSDSVSSWSLPVVAEAEDPPGPLIVWREGRRLAAATVAGAVPPGWPLEIPGYAVVAAPRGAFSKDVLFVPDGDSVRVLVPTGSGVTASALALPVSALVVGQLDLDPESELAGIDTSGVLHVYDEDGGIDTTRWSVEVGEGAGLPVLVNQGGAGWIAVAAPDPIDPVHRQRVLFVSAPDQVTEVGFDAPPIRYLSAAAFPFSHRAAVVAADEAGVIHVIFPPSPAIALPTWGPLAGEVLCADVDGNGSNDLVALSRDGTLMAWDEALHMVPGFPRHFPFGATENLVLADSAGTRYAVVTDTAGVLWSLPLGSADRPAAWPQTRGTPGRSGYLCVDQATPVTGATLRFGSDDPGQVCWTLADAAAWVGLRLRVPEFAVPLWQGRTTAQGCAALTGLHPGDTVHLEGRDRGGRWTLLAETRVTARGRLFVGEPYPNPFRSDVRLPWRRGEGAAAFQVFDVRGRRVGEWTEDVAEGEWVWDGRDGAGRETPPGLYFLRVRSGPETTVRRVLRIP